MQMRQISGKRELPLDSLPMLVRFRDINDPLRWKECTRSTSLNGSDPAQGRRAPRWRLFQQVSPPQRELKNGFLGFHVTMTSSLMDNDMRIRRPF
jgi:hypothetical protein